MSQLIHGGDIYSAAKEYGVPLEQWLDLSTGINPDPYPVPKINAAYFQRLPYIEYELTNAIEHYYGIKGLACAGSQQAIGLLPRLLRSLQGNHKVLLPTQGYQEHRYSWQGTGAECEYYPSDNAAIARQTINKALAAAQQNDEPFYLVIINPNNPSGL
ncbi:MAG: aminotransferase class I/II-fold pyridoxal phosphate-dependent enzyme, partial [Pontibacterium sp.]